MRFGDVLALGLAAGVVAYVASTRRAGAETDPTPPGPDPQPPPPLPPSPDPAPIVLRAMTVADADLKAQPVDNAATVRRLPRGTVVATETSVAPGWVYGTVHLPLPPVEGWIRVADLTYVGV